MSKQMEAPKIGDMYRCTQCELEIHVTKGRNCRDCTSHFQCCGQQLEKVTALPVQNA